MTNDEARMNDEVRMSERKVSSASSSFEHSTLFRHSSFGLRHSAATSLSSNLSSKERIVLFLLTHRRHRAVPWANDGFVRQRQDFLEIISQRVLVRDISAAH